MLIRYVCSDRELATNAALAAAADAAARAGIVLAGTVQPVDGPAPQQKCEITLALLPDGQRRNISLDLGPGATGCRLDAGALEEAVMIVRDRLDAAQALVVNKFGKQEAIGRGLVGVIGEACERGLPVLVGVAPEWRAAFLAFAGEQAGPLPADPGVILDWLRDLCPPAEAPREGNVA